MRVFISGPQNRSETLGWSWMAEAAGLDVAIRDAEGYAHDSMRDLASVLWVIVEDRWPNFGQKRDMCSANRIGQPTVASGAHFGVGPAFDEHTMALKYILELAGQDIYR